MKKPLRYVIVGTGGFGGYWCGEVLPWIRQAGKAEPVAAVDINPEHLKLPQETLGLDPDRCYTDLDRALDENPADFLIIVVPPEHHETMVDAALARGLHILSEKPIADTMEACCRVYRKVRAAGRKMAVTMSHRFDQDKQTLERELKTGAHGQLSYLVGRNTWACRKFASWGKFRHEMPDPLLVEGTVHHFDIIRALTGSNAKTVYAVTWNPPWGEYAGDSVGLLTMEMQNGVKVFYEGNQCSATTLNGWTQDYWRAECDRATLELDNRRLRILSDLEGDRKITERPLDEQPAWTNPWLAEMFCDWLLGGEPPPNTLDDNIQCAALLFAAVQSAHTRSVVDVQAFLVKHLEAVQA